jgi:hypothetical protein
MTQPLRVLVACEFSGVVRDAFLARGHNAMSCDLLPSEQPGPHYQGDVRDVLGDGWDVMVAHPPCTDLAVSGARYFARKGTRQAEALAFVRLLLTAPIPRIALENPVSIISTRIGQPQQIVHPWQFGHADAKTTCLWLRGLLPLRPTKVLPWPASGHWDNQTPSGQNRLAPSDTRWMERSRTYTGLADAMADQWGDGTAQLGLWGIDTLAAIGS